MKSPERGVVVRIAAREQQAAGRIEREPTEVPVFLKAANYFPTPALDVVDMQALRAKRVDHAARDIVHAYIDSLENFQTIGRIGLHRYDNQDHAMLSAILAVKNIMGESHDVWSVNTELEYHEAVSEEEAVSEPAPVAAD